MVAFAIFTFPQPSLPSSRPGAVGLTWEIRIPSPRAAGSGRPSVALSRGRSLALLNNKGTLSAGLKAVP